MQTNDNEKFINLVLDHTGLNQKSLAKKLGVSQTLITRWKQGDNISFEHSNKMQALLGFEDSCIGVDDIAAIVAMGGVENYHTWFFYVVSYYERNHEHIDLDFPSVMAEQFHDNEPKHIESTLNLLVKCGVPFPTEIPEAVTTLINYKQLDDQTLEELEDDLEINEGGILHEISTALHCVMRELIIRFTYLNLCHSLITGEQLEVVYETQMEVEGGLTDYAVGNALKGTKYAGKLELTDDIDASKKALERAITKAKENIISNNLPIVDHLDNVITYTADELDCKIEAHQMGFAKPIGVLRDENKNVHELLKQSEYQTQMLEAICNHLGIKI